MGIIKGIRQEIRSLGEDARDIKEGITSKAKAFREARRQSKESPKVPYKTKFKEGIKKAGEALRVDKKLKSLKSRLRYLKTKIDSGTATLEDRLEYKKLKGNISQLPIQAGITAAQAASLAVAPILYPVGSVASGLAAAAGTKLAGSDKSNKRLVERVKSGKDLSPLERYKVNQANKLGSKQAQERAVSSIIQKTLQRKRR